MLIFKYKKKYIELNENELIIYKIFYKKVFKLDNIESIFINKMMYLRIYYKNKWYSYNVGNLEDDMSEKIFNLVGKLNENREGFWLYTPLSTQSVTMSILWCVWASYMTIDRYIEGDKITFFWIALLLFWGIYLINMLFYRKDFYYSFEHNIVIVKTKSGKVSKSYSTEEYFTIKKSTLADVQYTFKFKDNKISPIDDIGYPKEYSNKLDSLYRYKNNIK